MGAQGSEGFKVLRKQRTDIGCIGLRVQGFRTFEA